jgi:pimeloyl-ACP methyl ester carboxylesterase
MELETVFHEGEKGRPLLIFVHGMGMNVKAWSEPSRAMIIGGKYPLKALLRPGDELETSFGDMRRLAYPVLSWTQSRPVGAMRIAVDELKRLIKEYRDYTKYGTVLIGHSRGGLIARKYLEESDPSVRGLLTLAAPHRGTNMARWAVSLSPVSSALNRVIEGVSKEEVDSALRRVLSFLTSSGLRELLPDSKFFLHLHDKKLEGLKYISAGGTTPNLLDAISVPLRELISRVLPDHIVPEEMRQGYGDGLVSAASAKLPHGDEHRDFPVNHAAILFDKDVRSFVVRSVESFCCES